MATYLMPFLFKFKQICHVWVGCNSSGPFCFKYVNKIRVTTRHSLFSNSLVAMTLSASVRAT